MKAGDETLSRSKYLWLTNPQNMTAPSRDRFNKLRTVELKTARAWALKESLRDLWNYRYTGWATHSRLTPMIQAAKLIARHLPNVLTYFKHRMTNALAVGLKLQDRYRAEAGLWLSQPEQLQDRRLLPLRRLQTYPRLP